MKVQEISGEHVGAILSQAEFASTRACSAARIHEAVHARYGHVVVIEAEDGAILIRPSKPEIVDL